MLLLAHTHTTLIEYSHIAWMAVANKYNIEIEVESIVYIMTTNAKKRVIK